MCGICGILPPASPDLLPPILEGLRHRGPDSSGTFIAPSCRCALGHTRLAIRDLSPAGNQPYTLDSGTTCLVYNGELYNDTALVNLHLPGISLRSRCDTEVLYHLLRRHGPSILPELDGDFAFAFLDDQKGTLLLARDPAGVKPLYLAYSGGRLLGFASEMRPLLGLLDTLDPDMDALGAFFALGYIPRDRTPFSHVRKLPPGHALSVDLTSGDLRYWSYSSPTSTMVSESTRSPDVQADALYEVISTAVSSQLVSDVPVAVFLSGGLDSTIIAYHVRQSQPSQTIRFLTAARENDDGTSSDLHYASLVARAWDVHLETVPTRSGLIDSSALRALVRRDPDLIADPAVLASLELNRRASSFAKVVLTGMGADELFWGYPINFRAALAEATPAFILRLAPIALAMMRFAGKTALNSTSYRVLEGLSQCLGLSLPWRGACLAINHPAITKDLLWCHDSPWLDMLFQEYFGDQAVPLVERVGAFLWDFFLEKNLRYSDLAAMQTGIEARVPLISKPVRDVAFRLPPSAKCSALTPQGKVLLRRAYRRRIPTPVLRRRKAGFGLSVRHLLATTEGQADLLDFDFLRRSEVPLNLDALARLARIHATGRHDYSLQLYAVALFQEFVREYWT